MGWGEERVRARGRYQEEQTHVQLRTDRYDGCADEESQDQGEGWWRRRSHMPRPTHRWRVRGRARAARFAEACWQHLDCLGGVDRREHGDADDDVVGQRHDAVAHEKHCERLLRVPCGEDTRHVSRWIADEIGAITNVVGFKERAPAPFGRKK